MPYEFFLAFRYFYSRRRAASARVTALAAILGIACGVAALIVALALANGFQDEMRDKILRGTAHISLMRRDGQPMTEWRALIARLRRIEEVRDAAGTTYDGALLSGAGGSAYSVLRGVDVGSPRVVEEIRRTIISGAIEPLLDDALAGEISNTSNAARNATKGDTSDEAFLQDEAALPNAVIGVELASRANLRVNDVAQIISADTKLSLKNLKPRTARVRVCAIFRSGLYEYDATWIYVSLASARALANANASSASIISIETKDIYDVARIAARVREVAGADYITVDWQEANRPLFAALTLERRMSLIVIALIIFIAALNITTTLVLVVVERRSDIAIISAMGARARSITLIFMIEGACIGIIGAIAGALLGLAACVVGEKYHLVSLPGDVYSLTDIPFHIGAKDVALAMLVAFLLSLLATLYPARQASRVRPAEALRGS
ncbi:MAG: FtsX-like permease family protein [Pyrinomonadaceae bacterium]